MNTIEVWESITNLLAAAITECTVSRCYDVSTKLDDLDDDTIPRIYVQIESLDSKPTGSGAAVNTLEEEHTFTINLIRKTDGSEEQLDALVLILTKIMDTFRYRKYTIEGEIIVLVNSSVGTDGELFERDTLEDFGVFQSAVTLVVRTRRTV